MKIAQLHVHRKQIYCWSNNSKTKMSKMHLLWHCSTSCSSRDVTRRGKGGPPRCRMTVGGTKKSQQCHKYFLQYSTFASERSQVQTWGHHTCFLARVPSSLVTPLGSSAGYGEKQSHNRMIDSHLAWKHIFLKYILCH